MKSACYLLLPLLFALASCSSQGPVTPPPTTDYTPVADYRVGVGDALQISVWRNEELSVAVPVRPDGKISMPLIGDIVAAGHTPVELAGQITQGLKSFVRNPQVTVIVVNPSSADFQRRIRITGAVQAPQSIPYREGITVLDLVLLAGGTNEFASGNNAKLYRRINGETKVYPIYLDDLINKGKTDTNYPLIPSDIVTVPERAF
ncbi:XrtA/PEP-CTERM system exopolysaccharide export protein [Simiduia agarivorans]|uniref:Polysaccharide biosynthesis/export protein n=1 Tax=Simiduia agarivorans (strain DSM 21679 / JCM 13881 / BCRC 17597 / SA1) TaxID=1117647 RepID=K4KLL7_SIMAS|nr:XrtA/PEP-CTERM system exopolysaccharide export protein [Simiduia agarivorans]AFU98968.1 polysaccharide biosynthesis/export protein [Simiduia agarivorans SA1 = DSM 21679]